MSKFFISGRIPSKKNSKIMKCFGSRPMLLPSKNYKDWHSQAIKQLIGVKKIKDGSTITLTIYSPDKRAGDLSNKAESVMDLLVDGGIITDDNWNIVPCLILKYGGVSKDNPGVLVEVLHS